MKRSRPPIPLFLTAILLVFLGAGTFRAAAQAAKDSLPLYRQFPFIPSFKLLKTDSSTFVLRDVIPKKQAAVLILFSPTCSHCQQQAAEITGHIKSFPDVTFLFATPYPLEEIRRFVSDYGLSAFPNIHIGQDQGRNLGQFYKVAGIPSIYVYNSKGQLVKEFSTNVKTKDLLEALKK